MRLFKIVFLMFLCGLMFESCVSLMPVTVTMNTPLDDYKYVYIAPTNGLTSNVGYVYGGNNTGVTGGSYSKSANPRDLIAGAILKRGFTILPELSSDLSDETIIINYGESGRRSVFLGYTIEITLQIISAQNHDVICVGTAEGCGETEVDDIRIAINRCLDEIFDKP